MFPVFYLKKFTDDNQIVFPDEALYIYDYTSKLLFSYYIRFIHTTFDLDIVRAINIILFSLSLSVLTSEICSRTIGYHKKLIIVFSILGGIVGGYWAFFILKEAFSVAAISMLIIAHLRKSLFYFSISVILLMFARVDLLFLYLLVNILFVLKEKSKPLYYLSFIAAIILFYFFMNSEYSYSLKMFTISRRFNSEKLNFDSVSAETSNLQLIPFILSEPFRQALVSNLNSTFNPFIDLNPFVFIQRLYNIFAFVILMKCFKPFILKDKLYTFAFITIIGILCTHSVYRYLNTVLIPLTLYFIYLLWLNKNKA
ncbi:hypothetical protein LHV18_07010 [Providencia rettgeri]|uniref:hypothetical protein n=1 Tax=Providencia TaxID=586 RepID=UPI001CFE7B0F|nr:MULTISPECIES: hypothetical protein [Providencia]MCB4840381.1 hypothetical protein [Providencia rettgeri]